MKKTTNLSSHMLEYTTTEGTGCRTFVIGETIAKAAAERLLEEKITGKVVVTSPEGRLQVFSTD